MDPKQVKQIVAVVLCLLAAVGFSFYNLSSDVDPNAAEPLEWYMDLNTKELYTIKTGTFAPQDAPSGPLKEATGPLKPGDPAGVKAYVFACNEADCADQAKRFVGYLESFSVEGKALASTPGTKPSDLYTVHFYGDPVDFKVWPADLDPQTGKIKAAATSKCPNGVNACWPKK